MQVTTLKSSCAPPRGTVGEYPTSAPHHAFIVYAYDALIALKLSLYYILILKLTLTLTPTVLRLMKKHDVVHFSGRHWVGINFRVRIRQV